MKDMVNELLKTSKQKLLENIMTELTQLIETKAVQGVSVFESQKYNKHIGENEENPYSCITESEAMEIVDHFKGKGIFVEVKGLTMYLANNKITNRPMSWQERQDEKEDDDRPKLVFKVNLNKEVE